LNRRARNFEWRRLPHMKQWASTDSAPNIFDVLLNSISIMEAQITAAKLKIDPPDLVIQPRLGHIKFMDLDRADEAITEGYRETMQRLEPLVYERADRQQQEDGA